MESSVPTVIHVVDDDAPFRSAMSRVLRIEGYDVEGYEDAQQFLDKLPDDAGAGCILLDLQIPGISGVELQGRLAAMGSTIPIVFLSGHGDIAASVQAMKAGAE